MKKRITNYYKVLGLPRMDVSDEEIRKAFKEMVKKHHPDKNPDDVEGAHERTIAVNEAYAVLSDPVKRKLYDEELRTYMSDKRERQEASNGEPTRTPNADSILVKMGQMFFAFIGLLLVLLFFSMATQNDENDDE